MIIEIQQISTKEARVIRAPVLRKNQPFEQTSMEVDNKPNTFHIGAKVKNEHFMNHDPDNNILLCTDDGSFGIKGNILSPLSEIIKSIIAGINSKNFHEQRTLFIKIW